MTSPFWCVLEVSGAASQADHDETVERIVESAHFSNGHVYPADSTAGTSIYVEFSSVLDLTRFRLTVGEMAAFGVEEKVTWR